MNGLFPAFNALNASSGQTGGFVGGSVIL